MLNTIIFTTLIRVIARKHGLEASDIHELPKRLDELERYRAAYETLDEAFDNVPGYMGDESYGNELSLVLSTARDLAKWKSISLAEFRGELESETDGGE
jgi:thiamine phosphate synthase YjbQ (UPF0047 family)